MKIDDMKQTLKYAKLPYCNHPDCLDCKQKDIATDVEPRSLKAIIEKILQKQEKARYCQIDVATHIKNLMYKIHDLISSDPVFAQHKNMSKTWLHEDIHLFLGNLFINGNLTQHTQEIPITKCFRDRHELIAATVHEITNWYKHIQTGQINEDDFYKITYNKISDAFRYNDRHPMVYKNSTNT